MLKQRVGLIGLGMAVAPHAKSLLDLKERVDVVAWSPSTQRREAFGKAYPVALAGGLDALLTDPALDAVAILSPPKIITLAKHPPEKILGQAIRAPQAHCQPATSSARL
jgi:predicted dehydrogenase